MMINMKFVSSVTIVTIIPIVTIMAMIATHFLLLFPLISSSFVYDVLKPQFQNDFNRICSKYPFVQSHYSRLKNPTGKIFTFIFQQRGIETAGLGDRLAGLINAAGLAIRFNRSLIITSDSDKFHRLFRPYIPPESTEQEKRMYSYRPANLSWTKYNFDHNGNREYEHILSEQTQGKRCMGAGDENKDECAVMNTTDLPYPNIILHGNRAYLCRWYKANDTMPCKQQFLQMIGEGNHGSNNNNNNSNDSNNFMEIGGCMLRLVMWPTDLLWHYLDQVFESHRQNRISKDYTTNIPPSYQNSTFHLLIPETWKQIISLHFRCGDLYGFHRGADLHCQHSYTRNEWLDIPTIGNQPKQPYQYLAGHKESHNMIYGTPVQVASCSIKVLDLLANHSLLNKNNNNDTSNNNNNNNTKISVFESETIVHIASDSLGSMKQMNDIVSWSNTLISPKGCHIDVDVTFECLRSTILYWFIMSMSKAIIAQTEEHHFPSSGFTRYASVYGLQGDNLWDARKCENALSNIELSNKQYGNWQC